MSIKKDSKLFRVIQSFRKDFKFLKDNPSLLQTFYEYIFHKYEIKSEEGMIQVERLLFSGVFESYRSLGNDTLFSTKIKLYSWILPVHLSIPQDIPLEGCLGHLNKLALELSVSEMVDRLMELNKEIYRVIGRDKDHSLFFSTLVFVLIKSQREDLQDIYFFIERFRRRFNKKESEVEYYLTVFRASLEFIEKMEYYDLNISQEEFNRNILK